MPPLFVWGRILRPLGPETHGISSCLRALFSRSARQASSDDTTIVSQQKEQLQHQHEARDSQKKRKLASEPRMSPSERHQLRYTDPEYRQRKQQYAREWYRKQMLDPEFRQKRREYERKYYADRKGDVEWFRQHVYAANKRSYDRIYADDAMRQNNNAYLAKRNKQRYCADPQFRLYHGLKAWYRLHRDHLSQFVWKHWRPIYHEDKVERTCATCATTRVNGSRLWFERKNTSVSTPTLYDCLGCYTGLKWSKIVPIETKGKSSFYKPRDPEVLDMLEAREQE